MENWKNIDKGEKVFVILSHKEITTTDILMFSSYKYIHMCVQRTHAHMHGHYFK